MSGVAPVVRPCVLPRIAGDCVHALNALACHGVQLDWLDADGRGGCWRVAMDPPRARDAAGAPVPAQDADACDGLEQREEVCDGLVQSTEACDSLALWLRTDGASLRLTVPHAALAAWLAAVFPGVGRVDLHGWVLDAAVECLFDFLGPRLMALGLPADCRFCREPVQTPASADLAWQGRLRVAAPETGETWTLPLEADDGGLSLLACCLSRRPVMGEDVWLEDVPIPMRAMVGYTDLTQRDVRGLASGDVVLLDQAWGGSQGGACLLAPDGRALVLAAAIPNESGERPGLSASHFSAHHVSASHASASDAYTPHTYTPHISTPYVPTPYLIATDWISIMSPEEKENHPEDLDPLDFDRMDAGEAGDRVEFGDLRESDPFLAPSARQAPQSSQAPPTFQAPQVVHPVRPAQASDDLDAPDAPDPLDAIPVRLGFDLGARGMPLGEVRRLRPGQTLVLDCEVATAPVSLRANGRCIGHGELVDIDGRLGVRIVSLRRRQA